LTAALIRATCVKAWEFAEAIAGFNLLGALAISAIGHAQPGAPASSRDCGSGSIGWLSEWSLGAGYTISAVHGWVAWLLGPFAATILSLLIASLQLAVLAIHRPPNRGDDPT
jgi:hypothetical protein